MVTRNKLVFDLLELLRSHVSDDEDIDIRQLESYVKDYRADFCMQRFNKNPFDIDNSFIQSLEGLALEKVDSSTIVGAPSERYFMRTTKVIPNTVRRRGYEGTLLHIGPADKLDASFTITNYQTAISSGYGRFNSEEIFAFPYGGYIYLFSQGDYFKSLYYLNINGVFADPQAAYLVTAASTVYTGDENYYTPEDLKGYIVTSILRDKYGILLNPPVDKKDDGEHELESQTQRRR